MIESKQQANLYYMIQDCTNIIAMRRSCKQKWAREVHNVVAGSLGLSESGSAMPTWA